MFWEALFGLVFLVPVPGSSYGPGAGALFETVVHVGVDDRFRARARRALAPGTSGVALLLTDEGAQPVLSFLEAHGGAVVSARLTPAQHAELERELGGAHRPANPTTGRAERVVRRLGVGLVAPARSTDRQDKRRRVWPSDPCN